MSKQHTTVKHNKWKRAVALVTACQILSFALLPSAGMVAAEAAAQTQTQTKQVAATKGNNNQVITDKSKLDLKLRSAVLMEASTGKILVDIDSEISYPPASMTKMMTEYIVMEKVKKGELSFDDEVVAKKNASVTEGSRIFLAEGDTHKVRDLYIAMAIGSANDATVALAEHIAGSEAEFVKIMNETAKRLGMTKTHYINSTGLDWASMPEGFRPAEKAETMMSAMDVAKLVRAIVNDHPEFSEYTKIQSYKFRERDKTPISNLNWMLEANKDVVNFKRYAYQGLDGMKTGFTDIAQYCFAGTAVRDNMRLISVVMGAKDKGARFEETAKLLNHGFEHFEIKNEIAPKKTVTGVETAPIKKGVDTEVPIVAETGVSFVIPKGATTEGKITQEVNLKPANELVAPIKKGQQVGTVTFTYKDNGAEQKKTVNMIATEEVEKGSWWRLFFRAIGEFFADLFKSIKNLF
ncbi:D-alanyl-D-alanine carboxypeptidase family protein [Paenibacillus alvei]|uniref:D-alanyl-D-alanine carboxypeptidase family protein n=1 Tax=Paenibacillus alvei TaxID=44250 RepID=UPI000386C322|nr:D-alanyl-D-alanine carboxypeptidase family protein [Paenibacillus alvei]EPY13605.1 D-alanyl-D-alanine carboxypeptidase [Paenibacillus alvei A6-6i-x]